jgi:hypothetical protein
VQAVVLKMTFVMVGAAALRDLSMRESSEQRKNVDDRLGLWLSEPSYGGGGFLAISPPF